MIEGRKGGWEEGMGDRGRERDEEGGEKKQQNTEETASESKNGKVEM